MHKLMPGMAWQGQCKNLTWFFRNLLQSDAPVIEATGLYHLLVQQPVAYDVAAEPQNQFFVFNRRQYGRQKHLY